MQGAVQLGMSEDGVRYESRRHSSPDEMALIDESFLNELRADGIPEADLGHFAAMMDAAPETPDGNIESWQTFCNELHYDENLPPPSRAQVEAGKQAQADAEKEIENQLSGYDFLGNLHLLPYNWKVDLLMKQLTLQGEGVEKSQLEREMKEAFSEKLAGLLKRNKPQGRRARRPEPV